MSSSFTPPPPPSHPPNTSYCYKISGPFQINKKISYLAWNLCGASQTNIYQSNFDSNVPADVEYVEKCIVEASNPIIGMFIKRPNKQSIQFINLLLHIVSLIFFIGYFPNQNSIGSCPDQNWKHSVFAYDVTATCLIAFITIVDIYTKEYDEDGEHISNDEPSKELLNEVFNVKLISQCIGWVGVIVNHATIGLGNTANIQYNNRDSPRCYINATLAVLSTFRSFKYYLICHTSFCFIEKYKLTSRNIQAILKLIIRVVYASFIFACLIVYIERIRETAIVLNGEALLSSSSLFDGITFTISTMLSLGTSYSELQYLSIESRIVTILLLLLSISLFLNYFFTITNKPKVDVSTFTKHNGGNCDNIELNKSLTESLKKWYLLDNIPNNFRNKFLIVTIFSGTYVDIEHIKQLLEEAFKSECQKSTECRLVIMSTQTIPTSSLYAWNYLLSRKRWRHKVVFICGSGMLTLDLERCGVDSAEQIFIVNGASNSSSGQKIDYMQFDDRVVLQTEFVRTFNPNVEIYSEIFCPENRNRVLESGADHVMCILGLSYQLLGRMISCPGLDQLILWSNFYPAVFPKEFYGLNFPIAAGKAYEKFGIIPFAVVECFPHIHSDKYNSKYNIEHLIDSAKYNDQKNDVHRRLLLNPVKLSVTCTRLVFCFAPNAYAMYNFVTSKSHAIKTKSIPSHKSPTGEKMNVSTLTFDGQEILNERKRIEAKNKLMTVDQKYIFNAQLNTGINNNTLADETKAKEEKHELKAFEKNNLKIDKKVQYGPMDMLLPKDLLNFIPGSEHLSANSSSKKKIPLKQRNKRKRMTGLEIMASMDPSRAWLAGSNIVDHGQPLWSMWGNENYNQFQWRPLENAMESGFTQHTVICCGGCSSENVQYVIKSLRSVDNSTWTPIIIVSILPPLTAPKRMTREEPAPAHLWPHVYWLKGNCRERADLIRAAVSTCRDIILLPSDEVHSKVAIEDVQNVEKAHTGRLDEIGSVYFTLQEVRKLAGPNVKYSIATSTLFNDVNVQSCDVRTIRQLLFKQIYNPYLISLLGLLSRHSPDNLGERDENMKTNDNDEDEEDNSVLQYIDENNSNASISHNLRQKYYRLKTSSTLSRVETLQDFESLLRESFLRRKGIPPFLHGKSFKYLMEVFTEKYNTLPVALINGDGKLIACPSKDYIVNTSDFLLCTVSMEYDQFLNQSINAVRHARGKDAMKERRELLRSTNRLILQQLQAVESILERVNYVLRKTEKENPVQISNSSNVNFRNKSIFQYNDEEKEGNNTSSEEIDHNDETLSETAENLLNAVIGVRKTLREKQHILKGIALEKSESVEAAEVVFQQITINQSLMNILEEKCVDLQKRCEEKIYQVPNHM